MVNQLSHVLEGPGPLGTADLNPWEAFVYTRAKLIDALREAGFSAAYLVDLLGMDLKQLAEIGTRDRHLGKTTL